MAINNGYLKSGRTSESDEVLTPFYAVDPILKYIPKDKIIWCPFDNDSSAFVRLFKEHGYFVVHSHNDMGQNFFTYEPNRWDIIISNPPFSKKDKILARCYAFDKPFALLLPVNSLQGISRYKQFKQGVELLTFDRRIDYHTNGNLETYTKGNHFASAYFCRNVLPKELIIEELTIYQRTLSI